MLVHIVLFEFKPTIHSSVIQDACERMLALKDLCIHPESQKPYILSATGGRDNSTEGLAVGGFSHGFVSHFENQEDMNYYLEKDPAHLAFVASIGPIVQNVRVLNYTPGVL